MVFFIACLFSARFGRLHEWLRARLGRVLENRSKRLDGVFGLPGPFRGPPDEAVIFGG
jgi:hypothetical protein